jgi:fermentation-respiration switch protein FrsA (DUF1100 family)
MHRNMRLRRLVMVSLKWTLMLAAAGYVAFVAFLYFAQRSMLYHPRPIHVTPAAVGLPVTEETVATSDGERVILWHAPPQDDKPVVIYFPGNAEIVAMRAAHHRALLADGIGLIALSYRGYMGSTGSPTEPGLLRDAEAAYGFAAARYPAQRIVLWGHSLGTGVAVALAANHPVAKLILEAPFTSTADVAASLFPFVPVRWLMHDQFRSDERIAQVTASLLVLHGERDVVVPIRFGERLFALAHEPKRFARYPDGGHNDLDAFGAGEEARRFIAAEPR